MPDSVRLRGGSRGRCVKVRAMASLQQLLELHAPLLVLDAVSSRVQVGWLTRADARWSAVEEEAGVGIFRCLEELGRSPADAGAFVFCEGPGSVLGVRTTAMAIRAWQVQAARPAFAFKSLDLVSRALNRPDLSVIADARREQWHVSRLSGVLQRLPASALAGDLAMPEGFRAWSALPANVQRVPYSLAQLFPQIQGLDLFEVRDAPDAFLHEEPSYATWNPQIHRAP